MSREEKGYWQIAAVLAGELKSSSACVIAVGRQRGRVRMAGPLQEQFISCWAPVEAISGRGPCQTG